MGDLLSHNDQGHLISKIACPASKVG